MPETRPAPTSGTTYRSAGVDIDAADRAKSRIAERVKRTHGPSVLRGLGHFGGFFRAPTSGESPVLVSSADSVGTKVLLAAQAGSFRTLGIDLVNHCVDDILACGARPLFLLDYFATSKLNDNALAEIIEGLAVACEDAGCALIGGETAQLPGIYQPGTCDLAGFIVGVVDEDQIVDGAAIQPGDRLIGLPSSGLHTNGYTLARAALGLTSEGRGSAEYLNTRPGWAGGRSLGDVLLEPHRSYLREVSPWLETGVVRGMAHITGGGLVGNIERIVPEGLEAVVDTSSWTPGPLFGTIQTAGQIATREMYRVFNMGIGFVLVVRPDDTGRLCASIGGAREIGKVRVAATAQGRRASLIGLESEDAGS